MLVVNGIYRSEKVEDDKLYFYEVIEYLEILDLEVFLLFLLSLL